VVGRTDEAEPTSHVRTRRSVRHDWPCIATTGAHTSRRSCRPHTCALLWRYISTYISPLAPQPQRPAANGGCRSASWVKIGVIALPGCRPRSRARQSAQRTSPGWSRRCCRTTLSVRLLKSIAGQSSSASRLVRNITPAHAGERTDSDHQRRPRPWRPGRRESPHS